MFNESSFRSREFQRGVDARDCRKKRLDDRLNLRKKQRGEHLQKRRRRLASKRMKENQSVGDKYFYRRLNIKNLHEYVRLIQSADPKARFKGTKSIRMLLSESEPCEEIESAVNLGILDKFVEFMNDFNDPLMQYEAAWALTNLLYSNDCVEAIVKANGAQAFYQVFRHSKSDDCIRQAAWGIANLCGDSREITRKFINFNLIELLLQRLGDSESHLHHKMTFTWVLSNVYRFGSKLVSERIHPSDSESLRMVDISHQKLLNHFDVLFSLTKQFHERYVKELDEYIRLALEQDSSHARNSWNVSMASNPSKEEISLNDFHCCRSALAYHFGHSDSNDDEMSEESSAAHESYHNMLQDCLWAISYLVNDDVGDPKFSTEVYRRLIEADVIHFLIDLCRHPYSTIAQLAPAVRTLGALCTEEDVMTQKVVDSGFVDVCEVLLDNSQRNIVKETCWTLSNICAGSETQIESVISNQKVLKLLILYGKSHDQGGIRKEAVWTIANACSGGSAKQIEVMLAADVVSLFAVCLAKCNNTTMQRNGVLIEAIESVFHKIHLDKALENQVIYQMQEANIHESLDMLLSDERIHENLSVKVNALINSYFQSATSSSIHVEYQSDKSPSQTSSNSVGSSPIRFNDERLINMENNSLSENTNNQTQIQFNLGSSHGNRNTHFNPNSDKKQFTFNISNDQRQVKFSFQF